MFLGRRYCQSFQGRGNLRGEVRIKDIWVQEWSFLVLAIRGSGLVLFVLVIFYFLGFSRSQDSISGRDIIFLRVYVGDKLYFLEYGVCKERSTFLLLRSCQRIVLSYVGEEVFLGFSRSFGRWVCRGGSCGVQYLVRVLVLGVNSLIYYGGLYRRRSVSFFWQYGS